MIYIYKNFIIWLSSEGLRAISEDKKVRLKLKKNDDKSIDIQLKDMINWIDDLEKIKEKLVAAKRNKR